MLTQTRTYRFGLLIAALLAIILSILAILLTSRSVPGQDFAQPAHTDLYWQATYWDNVSLAGDPVVERSESVLDHNWGEGSPDPRLPTDFFSAYWTRYIDVTGGLYRITAISDDGIRVYIDEQRIIDHWYEHARETYTADIEIASGHHLLAVEYFESTGVAEVQLTWQPIHEIGAGPWHGEYYDNAALEGTPAFIRYDQAIDFDWRSDSPHASAIGHDHFSVRWTRTRAFSPGRYRFYLTVDDGGRLWVNHHLLIDSWRIQAATTFTADLYLPSGNVPIQLEYYEHEGDARVRLTWERIEDHDYFDPGDDAWRGEYYDNDWLGGRPDQIRYDRRIDFDWGAGAPMTDIDADHFSVRWARTVYFDGGRYRFTSETDDGVRLYIDGNLLIDKWQRMERSRYSRTRTLSEGYHTLRMEYFEATGVAYARLTWKRVEDEEEERPIVGNIITCVPPQPAHCAWIKVYRLDTDGSWIDISPRGFASCTASGYLKIDGLPIDVDTYGDAGHPYRVEQWVDGHITYSTGNFQISEPIFLVRASVDNYTSWQCTPP